MTNKYYLVGEQGKILAEIGKNEFNNLKKSDFERIYGVLGINGEFFDIIDANGKKTGRIKPRELVHREGDLHGAFHLHIYTKSAGIPYILFQKRSAQKDIEPGAYDTVAAGHYAVGENIEDGLREVKEEIGLNLKIADLISLGKRYNINNNPKLGIFNQEIQDVFLYECDKELIDYNLQREEVEGIIKAPLEEMIRLFRGLKKSLGVEGAFFYGKDDGKKLKPQKVTLTRDDIWQTKDDYYFKTVLLINQFVKGISIPCSPYNLSVEQIISSGL